MQAARPLADLIRRLSLKRVGHEASVGSLGDKGVPWSHNLKAHKAEGAEQGSCGGNRVRTAGQPAPGLQAHLPTHVTAPNEGPGVLPTEREQDKVGTPAGCGPSRGQDEWAPRSENGPWAAGYTPGRATPGVGGLLLSTLQEQMALVVTHLCRRGSCGSK